MVGHGLEARGLVAEVLRLDQARRQAMLRSDTAVLLDLLDDELTYIHSSGTYDDRDRYLRSLQTGVLRYEAFDASDVRMCVLAADAVLVAGRARIRLALHGRHDQLDNLFTSAWARRPRGWRMVSWQSTPVHPPAASGSDP